MNELPSGTVTLLFTDIEGSTRLLKQLGDRYGEVLSDHRRLLRAAFDAHGGREIDTQGDAFFVAFPRAKEAVAAAVEGQQALAEHAWPDGAVVRVRMGIHTGEPALGDEGYHGLGLHRGARICSAGHGGQILLSNVTSELLADEALNGLVLQDLGEKRLKDIDRPERLSQVVYPGMPASFPPLKTADSVPFEGREDELAEAVAVRFGWIRGRRRRVAVVVAALAVVVVGAVVLLAGGDGDDVFEVEANSLAVLSADGRTLNKSVPTGTSPGGVAIGEGAIWVTNTGEGTVSRIDPESNEVEQTIRVGTAPVGVAVAGGFVWVVNSRDGTVSQIDPRTAGGSELRRVGVGNQPNSIAADGDVLWVANSTDGTLSRIDADTGVAGKPIRVGAGADAIAAGADRLWVTSFTSATVTEIDAESGQVLRPINVGHGPTAVTVGGGAVWVVNALDGTVSKIDPESSSVVTTVPVGREPQGVAARGNSVWVTDEGGVLTEIDARRASVVRRTGLGDSPGALAVDGDGIYVTVRSSGSAHRGGVLRVVSAELDSMDPGVTYGDLGYSLSTIVGDGLVAFRRVSGTTAGQIVPDLAISLPGSTDGGRTYSFRLRRDLRYSTGESVKAGDFRRGIERSWLLHPGGPAFFGTIEGADKCKPKKRCDLSRGIATDDAAGTITFRLREPDPDFLYKIALPSAFPVPASAPMRDVHSGVPGTGPYRVESAEKAKVVLTRNRRFGEHSTAAQPQTYPDRIEVELGPDENAQLKIVERGDADVAFDALFADPKKIEALQTRRASQVYTHPTTAIEWVFLNTKLAPFDDVRVRRAVNFAVDRRAILRNGRDGLPTCQILPRDILGYQRSCPYPHNLQRARRLIAAAGAKGAEVELSVGAADPMRPHMLAVGRAMRDAGLHARVVVKSVDDHFNDARTGRVQAGWFAWVLDYPSPTNVFGPLLSCGQSENTSQFCNPSLEALGRRAGRTQTSDQPAAAELWAELDRATTDQAPWIPLSNFTRTTFVSERVGNFQYHPQWGVLLDQLWVR